MSLPRLDEGSFFRVQGTVTRWNLVRLLREELLQQQLLPPKARPRSLKPLLTRACAYLSTTGEYFFLSCDVINRIYQRLMYRPGHCRTVALGTGGGGMTTLSSLGIGTYLGDQSAETSAALVEAVVQSVALGGWNVIDTARCHSLRTKE